jgi:hypothetical protein
MNLQAFHAWRSKNGSSFCRLRGLSLGFLLKNRNLVLCVSSKQSPSLPIFWGPNQGVAVGLDPIWIRSNYQLPLIYPAFLVPVQFFDRRANGECSQIE